MADRRNWNEQDAAPFRGLLERLENRQALAGVIGLGYVGLPLGVEMARSGYRVIGYDVSEEVVSSINAGCSHIRDVQAAVVAELVDGRKLLATRDAARLSECDVISVCVPTPLSKTPIGMSWLVPRCGGAPP